MFAGGVADDLADGIEGAFTARGTMFEIFEFAVGEEEVEEFGEFAFGFEISEIGRSVWVRIRRY